MSQSEQVQDLAKAISAFQGELRGAPKDAANPFFKSRYADLESVWDTVRMPLAKHGLSVVQTTEVRDGAMGIVTTLLHSSGQWIAGFYTLNPAKNDPQSMGSALTYARRYTLAAILGVVQTDDDGESAMSRGTPTTAPQSKPAASAGEVRPVIAANPKSAAPKKATSPVLPKSEQLPLMAREDYMKELLRIHKPYLQTYPGETFPGMMMARYGVSEAKLLTTEQMDNFVRYLNEGLK